MHLVCTCTGCACGIRRLCPQSGAFVCSGPEMGMAVLRRGYTLPHNNLIAVLAGNQACMRGDMCRQSQVIAGSSVAKATQYKWCTLITHGAPTQPAVKGSGRSQFPKHACPVCAQSHAQDSCNGACMWPSCNQQKCWERFATGCCVHS